MDAPIKMQHLSYLSVLMVELFCNEIFLTGLEDLFMFTFIEEWSWENLLWKLVLGLGKFNPGGIILLFVVSQLSLLISSSKMILIFRLKPLLIFRCLLCLGTGSGVLKELHSEVLDDEHDEPFDRELNFCAELRVWWKCYIFLNLSPTKFDRKFKKITTS